jgi:hypothetical protein
MTELKPSRSSRRDRIAVDLGAKLRADLMSYCDVTSQTPSKAIRLAVIALIGQDGTSDFQNIGCLDVSPSLERKRRIVLRFTESELTSIQNVSCKSGYKNSQQWIVAAIRSWLTGRAHFGDAEINALAQSNYQLAAVGRNLNQIARKLNSEPDISAYRVDAIEDIIRHIKQHTAEVSSLIRMNIERWNIGAIRDDGN